MKLRQNLTEIIPDNLLSLLPDGYEIIGDIAVITIPDQLLPYGNEISAEIIKNRKHIKTVLRKTSKRSDGRRVATYEPIIGTDTSTIHHEFGYRYHVDLTAAFFTTRLSGERQRISSLITPDETVLIPFAGVGPFVIPVAARCSRTVAIELNPDACHLLHKNTRLNRVDNRVGIIRGDAMRADTMIATGFDRAIIPTPYGLDKALALISDLVKPGGWIHFYTFKNKSEAGDLINLYSLSGYEVFRVHRCGNVAPAVSRWVYDLRKKTD